VNGPSGYRAVGLLSNTTGHSTLLDFPVGAAAQCLP
jgi:hypothetical protein